MRRSRQFSLFIILPALLLLFTIGLGVINVRLTSTLLELHSEKKVVEVEDTIVMYTLISTFLITLLAVVTGIGVAYGITRPLKRMEEQTRSLLSGVVNVEPSLEGLPAEFRQFGDSFMRMVVHLRQLFRQRDRQLMDGLDYGVILTDENGLVLAVNQLAEQMLRFSPEQTRGKPLGTLCRQQYPDSALPSFIEQGLRREVENPQEFELPGSPVRRLCLSSILLRNSEGKQIGCLYTLRDLQPLEQLRRDIRLADSLSALGAISMGLAHEIKNPVSTINGIVQLIAQQPEKLADPRYQDYLQKEIKKLNELVETIIEFSHGEIEESKPMDLNQIAEDALSLAEHPEVAEKQVTIRKEFSPLPPFHGSEQRIRRALRNLIGNALDFTPSGGYVRLRSYFDEQDQVIVIEVANSGSHIDPSEKEKIFQPFYTTKTKGWGLGLPIAYQVIDQHQGKLAVESDAGETRFLIQLPLVHGE